MKIFKQIAIVLTVIVLAVCCLAGVAALWPKSGWKVLDIATGSMRPGMPPGTLVLVHSVPDRSLKVGDVITYNSLSVPGKTVTHRIIQTKTIGKDVAAFITKGDHNLSADPEVVAGQVVGKVVLHVPYLGLAIVYGKTPVGLGLLVILPALVIIMYEVELLVAKLRAPASDIKVAEPLQVEPVTKHSVEEPRPAQLDSPSPRSASRRSRKLDGITLTTLAVAAIAIFVVSVGDTHADLASNPAHIANNRLSLGLSASPSPSPSPCTASITGTTGPHSTNSVTCTSSSSSSTSNSNNVNITNASNQGASTGNSSGTAGNPSNSNSTNTNVTN